MKKLLFVPTKSNQKALATFKNKENRIRLTQKSLCPTLRVDDHSTLLLPSPHHYFQLFSRDGEKNMTQEQFSPKDKDFDVRFGEFFDKLGEGWKPIFQLAERINNMKESDLKKLTASDLERLKNLPAELDRQTLEEAEAILSSIETKEN